MKVKFVPQNIEVEIKPNESVLKVAQDHGIHIQSVCKGIPSCAECRVHIKEGETNVVPPLQPELELIGTAYYIDQRRLSCQLRCFGDVVVDLTEQIEKASRSTKNPQGRYVKEKEDSHARMGNILEEEGEVALPEDVRAFEPEEVEEAELKPKKDPPQRGPEQRDRGQRGSTQRGRTQHRERSHSRGAGNSQASESQSGEQSLQHQNHNGSEGRKRSNRRHRNHKKNKSQQPKSAK